MKVAFPHLGHVNLLAQAFFNDLGVETIAVPPISKKTIDLGVKYTPEMSCMPMKITMGSFLEAIECGADVLTMVGGSGPCRCGYFCEVEKTIIHDLGYDVQFITLEAPNGDYREFLRRLHRLTAPLRPVKTARHFREAFRLCQDLDAFEARLRILRPQVADREALRGILREFYRELHSLKGTRALRDCLAQAKSQVEALPLQRDFRPLQIGVVGDIYTLIEPYANMRIMDALGDLGVECHFDLSLSNYLKYRVRGVLPGQQAYQKYAEPYMPLPIGGCAQETVGHSVDYACRGFDGLIQVFPLTCMPEIVAESVLKAVGRDFDLPVLHLVMDEHSGEANFRTRLEAFVDMLEKRREAGVKRTFAI